MKSTNKMSCKKSLIEMSSITKLIGRVEELHKQQQDEIETMKQVSDNSSVRNLLFEAEGFQGGYGISLELLHSITAEMDLLIMLSSIISVLEGNLYVESADLIDGDKNGLPENEPEYYYSLRGKCYASADVSNLIRDELERISQTANACEKQQIKGLLKQAMLGGIN